MNHSRAHVIAIDPGLRAVGVAALRGDGQLLDARVWSVPSQVPRKAAERDLLARLDELLARYAPPHVVIEATYAIRNRSLAPVHRMARLFASRATAYGCAVAHVSSASARRHLLGNGKAGKSDTRRYCATLYPELRVYLNQRERWQERHFGNLFDAVLLAVDRLPGRTEVDMRHRTPRHRFRWFPFRLGLGTGRFARRDPKARPRT